MYYIVIIVFTLSSELDYNPYAFFFFFNKKRAIWVNNNNREKLRENLLGFCSILQIQGSQRCYDFS